MLLLQRWYRCRSIRHKYKGCIASAVLIQKRVRGMQAREFRLLQEVAAIIIQRCVLCVLSRRVVSRSAEGGYTTAKLVLLCRRDPLPP